MDENGESKLTGIRQIVRLKELLQKWQSVTLSKPEENEVEPEPEDPIGAQSSSGIPPAVSRRLTELISCDSDEEGCQTPEPPPDVPRGYLAVYVGSELRRFIIPTSYLSHSLFKVLLEKAEEEYGFDHGGGLTIPCEIETFKYLLKCMENHRNSHHQHQLQRNDNGNTCA